MSTLAAAIRNLAAAFLAGPWEPAGMARRGSLASGESSRRVRALARRALAAFSNPPDQESLTHFIENDKVLANAFLGIHQVFWVIPAMAPSRWPVPALATSRALAEWLGKAILHNCLRHGPDSQNRAGHADFRAYLAGRIAYVAMLHESRGRRLREWFGQIHWDEES